MGSCAFLGGLRKPLSRSGSVCATVAPKLAALIGLGIVMVTSAHATGFTVGAGSTVSMGTGTMTLGCDDLVIQATGTLLGEQGTISLAGDWIQNGAFTPGTSTVVFVDGCIPNQSAISGNSTFYNLFGITSLGKELDFAVGSTQTIQNFLQLTGAAGNLLLVRSSNPGVAAFLNLLPGAGQLIDYVDVQDNHAVGQPIGPGPPEDFNSVKSSNSNGWFELAGGGPAPAPALSGFGLLIAALTLLLIGAMRARRGFHRLEPT